MKTAKTTERKIEHALQRILSNAGPVRRVETYDDAGVLTTDSGLVVKTRDNREFQITIIRTR